MCTPNSLLTIYNASAGSGKTTRLVKELLKIILDLENTTTGTKTDPKKIRQIIGLTFTNAVANELKKRLITVLYESAFNEQQFQSYKPIYYTGISINDAEIKERCQQALCHILHNYSDLSLFTIDSFSNRILKSFAYELNYSIAYEISSEAAAYYSKATELFFDNLRAGDEKCQFIVEFIKLQKGEKESYKISELIDKITVILKNLVEKELDEDTLKRLKEKINGIDEKKLRGLHTKHNNILKTQTDKFNNKVKQDIIDIGIKNKYYNYDEHEKSLKKISGSKINGNKLRTINSIHKNPLQLEKLQESNFFVQSDKDYSEEKKQQDEETIKELYNNNIQQCRYIIEYDNNVHALKNYTDKIVITKIALELLELLINIKREDNVVFFSDFTKEISKVIQKETHADFIFEKVGTRYKNFLIDEFQDTSILQFHNLLPLIHNTMSEGASNYIVGDPKQSIYRWRNANVNQFIELFKNKEISLEKLKNDWNKFKEQMKSENLCYNFRSAENIVTFNNRIFDKLTYKDYSLIKNVYADAQQISCKKNQGYVEVTEYISQKGLSTKEKRITQFAKNVIETINRCLKNGFQQKDICILLRTNNDIQKLIQLIRGKVLETEEELKIISPEGLLIYKSEEVSFLVSFLNILLNKKNKIASAVCWNYVNKNNYEEIKLFYSDYIQKEDFKKLFSDNVISKLNIYQLCLNAIEYFKIPFNPSVQKFLDIVNKFIYQYIIQGNTIEDFVNFWEENKKKFTLTLNDTLNAVQIMTIHKSKGLEFPVVITFLDFEHTGSDYWYYVPDTFTLALPPKSDSSEPQDLIHDFKGMYLYLNTEHIKSLNSEDAKKLEEEEHLENINLIYVALTRAINRIYIYTTNKNDYYNNIIKEKIKDFKDFKQTPKSEAGDIHYTVYSHENENEKSAEKNTKGNEPIFDITHQSLYYNDNILLANNANSYADENTELGIKIHKLLEYLNDNNIAATIRKALAKGIINIKEKDKIQTILQLLTEHSELKTYFDNNTIKNVLNEASIFKDNNVYRPDKIIYTTDHQIVILEFKTGKELEKHKTQLKNYIETIQSIYPNNKSIKGFLIYVHENQLAVQKMEFTCP